MNFKSLKEKTWIPDQTFPLNIFFHQGFPLHWHDYIEWIFVKEGKANIQIDACFVKLQKGEIAFINSKQVHGAAILEKKTELISIVFNDTLVRSNGLDSTDHHYFSPYLHHQVKLINVMTLDSPYIVDMGEAFHRLVEEFQHKRPGYELLIKAEIFRVFGLFFRYTQQGKMEKRFQPENQITNLLHELRENYHKTPSIEQVAQQVNLSPNHFCKVFKQVTGKTLIEYLHLLRINEAERLLTETDLPVTIIAEKVGFSTPTYFGRIYKKIKNRPPSMVRK